MSGNLTYPRILVMRSDRLGDVLMSVPTLEYLRHAFPQSRMDFLCAPDYRELLTPYLKSREIDWIQQVDKDYDGVLLLCGEKKQWWSVWKRGGVRVGVYSKPLSFFLLSRGIRQSRSQSLQSEALYNLELAALLVKSLDGVEKSLDVSKIVLPGDELSKQEAQKIVQVAGIDPNTPFVLFHPGMGGSALNIEPDRYVELMEEYENRGLKVLLSVGPLSRDGEMKRKILERKPPLPWFSGVSLAVLREIFRLSKTVVAPSTGPLHLAHFVGTKTVGIYPPVRSQHPMRWAPWGGTGRSIVLSPSLDCPGVKNCIGASCPHFNCMEKTDWRGLLLRSENALTA